MWSDGRIVWNNRRDVFFSYLPGGGTWTLSVQVNDLLNNDYGSYRVGSPSIDVDGQGNVYVVWEDNRNNYSDIYFSYRPAGGVWTKPNIKVNDDINDSTTRNQKSLPKITVDVTGNAYVIWEDTKIFPGQTSGFGQRNIYSSFRAVGTGWAPSMRVNDDTGWAQRDTPAIAMNNFGDVFAIYSRSRSDGKSLFSSFLQPSDNLSPTSTHTLSGILGLNSWYTSDVNVTISTLDNGNGSGVKELHYILNGAETVIQGNTTTFTTLTNEGVNSLIYWAVDNASNIEPQNTATIKIDKSVPTINILSPIGIVSSPIPNISVNLDDPVSGVSSYRYLFEGNDVTNNSQLDLTYKMAGSYIFNVSVTDNAGNTTNTSSAFIYSPTIGTLRLLLDKMYADGEIAKLGTSLYDKLSQAEEYINSGNYTGAKTVLNALINQIGAQLDIHITAFSGNILISDIAFLINSLP